MKKHHMTIRAIGCSFIVVLSLLGCGRRQTLASSTTVVQPTTPVTPSPSPIPVSPIVCRLDASNRDLQAFVDAQGNFTNGSTPPAVNIKIMATQDGRPIDFSVSSQNFDRTRLQLDAPLQVQADKSYTGTLRPLKAGASTASFSIASLQNPLLTSQCSTEIRLTTTQPPMADVLITADGFPTRLPFPVNNGGRVRITYFSANTASCQLFRNGLMYTASQGPGADFIDGPLMNPTTNAIELAYEVRCVGTQGQIKASTVMVTVIPNLSLRFSIEGSGTTKIIRAGGYADLIWESSYATGGCAIDNGFSLLPVASSGRIRAENFTRTTVFTFMCKDSLGDIQSAVVTVRVQAPTLVVTANGNATSYERPYSGNVRIAWTGTDVTSCLLTPGNVSGLTGAVEISTLSISVTTTYTVTCQSDLGAISASVQVLVLGGWVQTYGQQCNSVCGALGKQNTLSPDGHYCASGEVLPVSAIGRISYTQGCYPGNCAPGANFNGVSSGAYCYGSNQKRDNDRTDITMGCFCR